MQLKVGADKRGVSWSTPTNTLTLPAHARFHNVRILDFFFSIKGQGRSSFQTTQNNSPPEQTPYVGNTTYRYSQQGPNNARYRIW